MSAIMMTANRDYTLRSIYGACKFEKGVPTLVSPYLINEALAVGILPVETDDLPGEAPTAKTPPVGLVARRVEIEKALAIMDSRMGTTEGRSDWTAARRPKVTIVSKLVGFKVHSDEINRIINERNEVANAEMLEAKKAKGKKAPKVTTEEPEGGKDYGT